MVILGYGAIARRLVELLAPFRLDIVGLRRQVQGNESVPVFGLDQANGLLHRADFVVNILPANDSTVQFCDAEWFAKLKPGAVFLNVGRGNTVDQPALINALETGQVSAAYLDVTDPEPLPADHPLWQAPNCYITPHIAGGHQEEDLQMVRHFLRNLAKFVSGQPLAGRILA